MVREETLRIAQEKDIRPEEAFELLKEEWKTRGVEPQRWFRWEGYCTPDEWEELQIHGHEVKIQALVTERNLEGNCAPVLFNDVMVEYKERLCKDALSEALFRAQMQGRTNPSGRYTTEQFNRCMNDTASRFDFQWAGGKAVFLGSQKDWPELKVRYRRTGHLGRAAGSMPSTTDTVESEEDHDDHQHKVKL